MRILVVEDNHKLASSIQKGLVTFGFAVDVLYEGDTALNRLLSNTVSYDCIVLDRMLPNSDGITICKEMRQAKNHTPVLMLTALDTVSNKVEGLDSGADDYLSKPFSFDELVARIRALLRRPNDFQSQVITLHGITLDSTKYTVHKNQKEISLTSKEFSILYYLMMNPDQVVSREQIMNHVWDYSFDSFSNVVDVHIKNLRKKLQNKNETIFETIHGVGYKFVS